MLTLPPPFPLDPSQLRSNKLSLGTILTLVASALERVLIVVPLNQFVGLLIHTSNKDRRRKIKLEREVITGDYPYRAPALNYGGAGDDQGMYLAALRVSIIQLELAQRALEAENPKKSQVPPCYSLRPSRLDLEVLHRESHDVGS